MKRRKQFFTSIAFLPLNSEGRPKAALTHRTSVIQLAPPAALGPVVPYVTVVAVNIVVVAIDVAIFPAQFGALMLCPSIVPLAQVPAQLPAVMLDFRIVALDIAVVSIAICIVVTDIASLTPAILRQQASRSQYTQ